MAWATPPTLRVSASSFVSKLVWNHWILMQAANVAPLKGRPLLASRGAVFFLLIDLCLAEEEIRIRFIVSCIPQVKRCVSVR